MEWLKDHGLPILEGAIGAIIAFLGLQRKQALTDQRVAALEKSHDDLEQQVERDHDALVESIDNKFKEMREEVRQERGEILGAIAELKASIHQMFTERNQTVDFEIGLLRQRQHDFANLIASSVARLDLLQQIVTGGLKIPGGQ